MVITNIRMTNLALLGGQTNYRLTHLNMLF
jgi:hypothetical protein